jgi:hypothetical protein
MIKVKYVGGRESFYDNLYGTKLTWNKGDVLEVPEAQANKLLDHPEFERSEAKVTKKVEVVLEEEPEVVEEPPLVNLESLTKAQLTEFAHRQFNVKLDPKETAANMRDTIRLQMGRK